MTNSIRAPGAFRSIPRLAVAGILMIAVMGAGITGGPASAFAADRDRPGFDPLEQIERHLSDLLQSFEQWLDGLPRFGAPLVTPEGDIIIPRRDDHGHDPRPPSPDSDGRGAVFET